MTDMTEIVRVMPQQRGSPRRDRDGLHKRRGIWHYKLKINGKWREVSTSSKNYQEAKGICGRPCRRRRKVACRQTPQG